MQRRHHSYGTLARAISSILYATSGALAAGSAAYAQDTPAVPDPVADVVTVMGDPLRALGSGPSESSFGFAKSLLETPRAVSFISEEQITLFGISTVEDLTRARSRNVHRRLVTDCRAASTCAAFRPTCTTAA